MSTRLIVLLVIIASNSYAQSTTRSPQVINVGGGSKINGTDSLEWSIGESASIDTYISGNLYLYTGILQTSILYPFIRNIDPGQIKLGPNPFRNKIKIETAFKTNGKVVLTVYDSFGRSVFSKEVISSSEYLNESLMLYSLGNGIYFLEIIYSDQSNQKVRSLHKIIKY